VIGTGYLVGGAAVISAVLAFGSAWTIQGWRQDAARYAAEQVATSVSRDNVKLRERAAEAYQDGEDAARRTAVKNDPKVIYVASKPEYRADCLDDDGLQLVADEIRAANARRKPAPAVPGDPTAGRQVEGDAAAVERGDDPRP
jgi:hypothetical protein